MSTREAAVALARLGWSVFPCRPGDKRPAVDRWEQRAVADPGRVGHYWPSDRHNIGLACGPSGLVVIDLDPPDGEPNFDVVCHEHGQHVPSTFTIGTPRGGLHLYFAASPGREIRNSAGRLAPHIDVRGAGGYVLAPGSAIGGREYRVISSRPVLPLPGWLGELLFLPPARGAATAAAMASGLDLPKATAGRLRGLIESVLDAKPGQRNNTLHWAACRFAELVTAGEVTRQQAFGALTEAGICAGLPEREAERTIMSALRAGGAE